MADDPWSEFRTDVGAAVEESPASAEDPWAGFRTQPAKPQSNGILQSIRTRGGTLTEDQVPTKDTFDQSLLSPKSARILLQTNPLMFPGEVIAKYAPKSAAQIYEGAEQGVADIISGASSLPNLAMLAIAPEGVLARRLVSTAFVAQALKQFPAQMRQFNQEQDVGKKTELAVQMAIGLGLPVLGMKGGKGGEGNVGTKLREEDTTGAASRGSGQETRNEPAEGAKGSASPEGVTDQGPTIPPISEIVPPFSDPAAGAWATVKSRVQQIRDAVGIQSVPKSIRAGVGEEVIQHASARLYVPRLADDLLAKVFPEQYKDSEAMSQTIDILNKDNVLGGYDEQRANLAALRQQVASGKGGEIALGEQEKWLDQIEGAHDLRAYEADVQAAKKNPVISANIERWKTTVSPLMDQMYNEMKGVDPSTPRETRGRNFGARLNLLPENRAAELHEWTNPDKPMPQVTTSNYRNPNVKRDQFMRQAKLTGQYSTDPNLVLLNSFGGRWNEVTKIRLYNGLVNKGVAVMAEQGQVMPETIGGKPAGKMAIKMPETNPETGRTQMVERSLFVQKDLVPELRTALDTDMRFTQHPIAKALTQLQLMQLADATAHNKNIHTVITSSLGRDAAWKGVVSKVPFASTIQAVSEISKVSREISADTPSIRSEIAEMAKKGMIRPDYPASGVQKITHMQQLIHGVDTASRVIMNRRYSNLVERGWAPNTAIGRRNFVQQIGEYNRRLMGRWEQTFRDKGLSPFIVAGRTFNKFSKRMVTGDPGFSPTNKAAAVQARAAQLSGLVFAATVPAFVNMFTTGSIFGREGTPIGAVDLGPRFDTKDGKRRVVDVFQLTGIRRGLRGMGINAVVEGIRNGRTPNEIAGDAANDVITTAAHPWTGPAVGAAYQTLTGHRIDLRSGWAGVPEARKVGGIEQYAENARVALRQQNPLLYGLMSSVLGKDAGKSYLDEVVTGGVKSPLSALGYRELESPAMQAVREINRGKAPAGGYSIDNEEHYHLLKGLGDALKSGDPTFQASADKAVAEGKMKPNDLTRLYTSLQMTPLQIQAKKLSADEAMKVWEVASPKEKEQLQVIMTLKILGSKKLTPTQQSEYLGKINEPQTKKPFSIKQ